MLNTERSVNKQYFELLKSTLPDSDVLSQCMHCGMCLAACPTYEKTQLEASSPRGRIRLIKMVAEQQLKLSSRFVDEINFCLDCQACESACPAGVKYGQIVESARELATNTIDKHSFAVMMRKFALNLVLANKTLFKYISRIINLVQKTGFDKWLAGLPLTNKIIPNSSELLKLLPDFASYSSTEKLDEYMAPISGRKKYRVAFLTGCLMDTAFADTNLDTVELLRKLDCEIIIPKGQVCCGSLHAHNGEMKKAYDLARKNIEAFSGYEYDYLVSNSAGCGAFMKEYGHIFKNDPQIAGKAENFSKKVLDVTEFMSFGELKYKFREFNIPVTYHDACHLCHTQKITNQPRELINRIPSVDYRPLEESTWCCGSAGIYNVIRYNDSMHFLNRKIERIKKTGAEIIVTGNPGCYLQIKYGVEKYELQCKVEHTASFFNKLL